MLCYACGYQDSTINGPHTCSESDLTAAAKRRAAGSPAAHWSIGNSWAWPAFTWVVLAITFGYGLVCVARFIALAGEYGAVSRMGDVPSAAQRADVISAINFAQQFSTAYFAAVWFYLAAFVAWFVVAARIVKRLGASRGILRHWTVAAWRMGIVVSLAVVFLLRTPTTDVDDLASARAALLHISGTQMVYTGLRVATVGLLIAAVWVLRGRVSTLVSEPSGTADGR
jgi:hypothetical protein